MWFVLCRRWMAIGNPFFVLGGLVFGEKRMLILNECGETY